MKQKQMPSNNILKGVAKYT